MAVPTVMSDLSITAASNSPAGTDVIGTSHDDYLRAYQAILRTTNAKGTDIVAAATTDIGGATAEFIDVTGSTTITALGTIAAGIVRTVRFTGSPLLTHNATSLILPGGVSIQTATGDVAMFRSLGSGNWVCVGYSPALGGPVAARLAGRLTLASSTPVTTTDQTAKTTVYWTPYTGAFTELSLALDADNGHTGYQASAGLYDLFLYNDAGIARLGTGPAWASATTRGAGAGTTELTTTWPRRNANTMTLRFGSASGNTVSCAVGTALYLGTMCMTADGTTEDSLAKRFLWNGHKPNRVARPMKVIEGTDSWTYSTLAYRLLNNSAANVLNFVRGLDEEAVHAQASITVASSGATGRTVYLGIGLDASNAVAAGAQSALGAVTSVMSGNLTASYHGFPGLGYHYLSAIEAGNGTDTQTWFGDNGSSAVVHGITGMVFA